MRLAASNAASDVRSWAKKASDDELMTLIRGVREVHASQMLMR